ncbi:hypothetical protein GQ55_3G215200 [Panicum hallii var. hallii]|uniref:Ubiquitin-like protease family profile domain-containing protein n=1 Tax=Panicum hallii var. hallii TaxID=1504633 RepID=A0A2T7EBZ1_9POAL|nr:hypothetical protein GQ55_3G215200 [Panicum hallii var. hallii]
MEFSPKMVIAPVLIHWHWCMYVWDFGRNKIIVLDPMDMPLGEEYMATKHRHSVSIMRAAMQEAKQRYFPNTPANMETWGIEYLTVFEARQHYIRSVRHVLREIL